MSKTKAKSETPASPAPPVGHTPGPWKTSDVDQRGVYADAGAALVATVHTTTLPESGQANRMDVTAANARLIAAAPDLLDACRAELAGDDDAIVRIRAAVLKATGEGY